MMTGTITDGRPHINLLIKGAKAQALAEFTSDTGYSRTFTLPLADCYALGLSRKGKNVLTLPTVQRLIWKYTFSMSFRTEMNVKWKF